MKYFACAPIGTLYAFGVYGGPVAADQESLLALDEAACALTEELGEVGYRRFDFGRSKPGTGAFNFKRHWCFEPEPLFYEHRLFGRETIPQRNSLNPKYALAIALWKELPHPVANRIGPILARGLG